MNPTIFASTLLAEESNIIQTELGLVFLLFIAALVAIFVRQFRHIPYTTALVIVGLVLALFPNFLQLDFSSDVILAVLVPPLLFEATLHVPWARLKADLNVILLLAIGGTLLGTFMVGGVVMLTLGIPLAAALAFGALISATDPVAVITFFRSLGVNKRLGILVEGESLFNDGTAIVLFNMALLVGVIGVDSFGPAQALQEFLLVSLGGIGVGLVMGYIVSVLILKNVDDHLIETATTVALAFGSYVVAESFGKFIGVPTLHLSGILAVVAAGLMVGNIGLQNTSPSTRLTLDNFWEFAAYLTNSIIFLAIGLEIQLVQLTTFLVPILVAVVTVLLSRAMIVYATTAVYSRLSPKKQIPVPFRHVMFWGGLRGAISLALALSLDADIFGADYALELRVMTFGVVLFTLLVQGTTIEGLIKRLKLSEKPTQQIELQRRQARLYAKRAGKLELDRLRKDGILYGDMWQAMGEVYDEEINASRDKLLAHLQHYPEMEQELFLQAREDVLKAERRAVSDAQRRGLITEEVHSEMIEELNNRLAALDILKENRGLDDEKRDA